ncbi:unnamed protein product [Spirodela intermedia]|uniref:Uncharacterized protein n=1 Tax=Spirodela intermedia TaxID=51605 RepID=A0A7I8IPM4_SPIIN|nr:unnamed protein product [Spirodela intermedia]CAA6659750.1 unnamed protein product [Spirodela intermedia]
MGRRVISGGCHPAERKNSDFAALGSCHLMERSWMEVGGVFIIRFTQQKEALHCIRYALKRWQLVSRRIVLFPTTTCSSINRRCFTRWIRDPLS